MKKLLIATTALVATAGVAAADVTVSGTGRMGVTHTSKIAGAVNLIDNPEKSAFTSRLRIIFTATGESDGGLSFGGTVRADNAGGGNAGTAGSVFVAGAFGRLTMGDVDGAAEARVGDVAGVGLTGLGDYNENVYLSNSNAAFRSAARYDFSTSGFTFSLSADNPGTDVTNVKENTYSLGASYAMGAYTVGLGYETTKLGGQTLGHTIIGVGANFGDINVRATYGAAKKAALGVDFKQYGLSASGTFGATTVTGFVRQVEGMDYNQLAFTGNLVAAVAGQQNAKGRAIGLGVSHDLGGGLSVQGGIAHLRNTNNAGNKVSGTMADIGLSMRF